MPSLRKSFLGAYRLVLRLYPLEFGERYATEIFRCAHDLMRESNSPLLTGWRLSTDLVRSLLMEHLAMTARNKAVPQLAVLFTLTTFIAGTGYVISQQVLRESANDPQIQLAEDAAQRLRTGNDVAHVVPERRVDIDSSLAPFVIVYDDAGRPVASSASLDGSIPAPPKGVFDFVRVNREERVTWQPRPGVRIASVVTRYPHGFVVAGRNMREIEAREFLVLQLAAAGWLFANVFLSGLWLLAQFLGKAKVFQASGERLHPAVNKCTNGRF